ncbi:class I SAM-dependent methyltransferase [Thermococcus argininiproducens]|uniref:Class I SAM-dependent methyltransferase n=1 Tax=Thermococcus argininiproducens TaxID=2866384 RepID=A0A9E7MBW0_9EURY|nr:class I SAM-dependent methyltransferase [Thermococcus argininiproducens]USH00560.1 class I SAM-dependent methyltransferase [Thermococcus argininiproducens]
MGFEEYYQAFRAYTDIYSKEYQKRIEELEPYLLKFMEKKGKVLDLACGVGGFSFLLEEYGFDIIGVDISEKMIEKARTYGNEKNSKVEFLIGNAMNLPFEDNIFDYVIFLGNTTTHFLPRELNRVFKEVRRVLKKEGLFLINFIDMRELLSRIQMGTVIGEKYWINKVVIDKEEKTALIEYRSDEITFRVRFVIWGSTTIDLLARMYFTPIETIKLDELSYLNIYKKK